MNVISYTVKPPCNRNIFLHRYDLYHIHLMVASYVINTLRLRQNDTHFADIFKYIFSCNQAALWMVLSIYLSACPSISFTIFLSLYRHEILRSNYHWQNKNDVHAKGPGQRSRWHRSKQILLQFGNFWAITPVWIHKCIVYEIMHKAWRGVL